MKKILVCLLCPVFVVLFFDILPAQVTKSGDVIVFKAQNQVKKKMPNIGTMLQEHTFSTPEGESVKLSSFKGTIVVMELGSCATWGEDEIHTAKMDKLANDFSNKGVEFFHVYIMRTYATLPDFSRYKRSVLLDEDDSECVLNTITGGNEKSLFVIDKEQKLALFQSSPNPDSLKIALEKMVAKKQ